MVGGFGNEKGGFIRRTMTVFINITVLCLIRCPKPLIFLLIVFETEFGIHFEDFIRIAGFPMQEMWLFVGELLCTSRSGTATD